MKFDYIIGNPPYQDETGHEGNQVTPIYNIFFDQLKTLAPKVISLIIPSRWFTGGMGLDSFRNEMMNCKRIKYIDDFINAKQCFPDASISGGVCIFLWDKDYCGNCEFTNIKDKYKNTLLRPLNEFKILVRYNQAVYIIHKIQDKTKSNLVSMVSPISPFGLSTKVRGAEEKENVDDILVYSSAGSGYIPKQEITKGKKLLNSYHVMLSQTSAEHAGEYDKDGKYRVLTSAMRVINPNEGCTHSYIIVGCFDTQAEAANMLSYLKTCFVRMLIHIAMSSIHITKVSFEFVPLQDFTSNSDIDWSKSIPEIDQQLYKKYGLDDQEIEFIESHVKPME